MLRPWEMEPEDLTPHLLEELLKWQDRGRRTVDIKISHTFEETKEKRKVSIFCYNHDVSEGKHVTKTTEIPTTKELIQRKEKAIEQDRLRLTALTQGGLNE